MTYWAQKIILKISAIIYKLGRVMKEDTSEGVFFFLLLFLQFSELKPSKGTSTDSYLVKEAHSKHWQTGVYHVVKGDEPFIVDGLQGKKGGWGGERWKDMRGERGMVPNL